MYFQYKHGRRNKPRRFGFGFRQIVHTACCLPLAYSLRLLASVPPCKHGDASFEGVQSSSFPLPSPHTLFSASFLLRWWEMHVQVLKVLMYSTELFLSDKLSDSRPDARLDVETSEASPLWILPLLRHSSACYSDLSWLSIKKKGFTRQQRHLCVECVSCVLCEVTGLEKAASCVINMKGQA